MVTQNWENVNIWMRSQCSANALIRSVKFTPQASTFDVFSPVDGTILGDLVHRT